MFNPNTDQIRVVNTTRLFVWKMFGGHPNRPGMVMVVKVSFEEVPESKVADQVRESVNDVVAAGFIRTVEDWTGIRV